MNRRVEESIKATREAEAGLATCRNCGGKGILSEFIAVIYGGGLVYAMCMKCAENGHTVLIRRGPLGIEVLGKKNSQLAVGHSGIDVIKELTDAKAT